MQTPWLLLGTVNTYYCQSTILSFLLLSVILYDLFSEYILLRELIFLK